MAAEAAEETSETEAGKDRTPLTMIIPAAVLLLAAVVIALLPHLGGAVQAAAARLQDQAAYNATVPSGAHVRFPAGVAAMESTGITAASLATGAGSAVGGLLLAYLALYWRRLPLLRCGFEPGTGLVRPIRRFQSGIVNDYVTWIVIGVAGLGGGLAFAIR
jgi:multicomponent Na+:H+ antiporter subunit D